MTIEELYNWGKENNALDLPLEMYVRKSYISKYTVDNDLYEEGSVAKAEIGTHIKYGSDVESEIGKFVKLLES